MHYHEPVFRPPSEAASLLLPVTDGCSRNRCTFCAMYATKTYRALDLDTVFADIDEVRAGPFRHRRAFLLDGDALSAPQEFLESVLARSWVTISSESTSAFGQPRETKPTDGAAAAGGVLRGRRAADVAVIGPDRRYFLVSPGNPGKPLNIERVWFCMFSCICTNMFFDCSR